MTIRSTWPLRLSMQAALCCGIDRTLTSLKSAHRSANPAIQEMAAAGFSIQDNIGRLFSDHVDRCNDKITWDPWKDRGIHNAQIADTVDAE